MSDVLTLVSNTLMSFQTMDLVILTLIVFGGLVVIAAAIGIINRIATNIKLGKPMFQPLSRT